MLTQTTRGMQAPAGLPCAMLIALAYAVSAAPVDPLTVGHGRRNYPLPKVLADVGAALAKHGIEASLQDRLDAFWSVYDQFHLG